MTSDYVNMTHYYANLLADMGEVDRALQSLEKCAAAIKEFHTDLCGDYADIYFDMGTMHLQKGNVESAQYCFVEAFRVYNIIYESDREYITERFAFLCQFYEKLKLDVPADFIAMCLM